MRSIGGTLFFFGLGSIVLYFLKMEFILLAWIEMFGELPAWAIRIGMTIGGGLMWIFGNPTEE